MNVVEGLTALIAGMSGRLMWGDEDVLKCKKCSAIQPTTKPPETPTIPQEIVENFIKME